MRTLSLIAASAAAAFVALSAGASPTTIPQPIALAVADPARPDEDKARDADRHPAEVIAFSGMKPGDKVVDLMPGGGYFTRIFAGVVGPTGAVYAFDPVEVKKFKTLPENGSHPYPDHPNVTALVAPIMAFAVPETVDLVWTSQNYHDLKDDFMGPADTAAVNAAVFRALKPGGVYMVSDHAAESGSGVRDTATLHRIDPAVILAEVKAAGFVLDGESNLLRNPADDHKLKVFDDAIRGKTDQVVFKFRKPG